MKKKKKKNRPAYERGQPAASCLHRSAIVSLHLLWFTSQQGAAPLLRRRHFPSLFIYQAVVFVLSLSHSDRPSLCFCHVDISWDSHTLLTKLSPLISLHSRLWSVQPCSQVSCFVACMKRVHCSVRKRGRACVCAQAMTVLWFCFPSCRHPTKSHKCFFFPCGRMIILFLVNYMLLKTINSLGIV